MFPVSAKYFKWGMFKGTLELQRLYVFNPRLLKNPYSLKIGWQIISYELGIGYEFWFLFTERKSAIKALKSLFEKKLNTVRRM